MDWTAHFEFQGVKHVTQTLSPDGEAILAFTTAHTAALQVLVTCLQSNGALQRGEFQETLRLYMETAKDRQPPAVLAILHDLRQSLLD